MKLVAKPIDVLVVYFRHGRPRPYRFRYTDENGDEQVVRINKVIRISEHCIPGVKNYVYECQSRKDSDEYRYELLYNPLQESWLLYKI